MTTLTRTILTLAILSGLAGPAGANDAEPGMRAFLTGQITPFAADPAIVSAIRAQNMRTATLSQAEIDRLDQAWRADIGITDTQTISAVLGSPAADFLRRQVDRAAGAITEIFLMDAKGLNVAASSATSDYWQGDEAKFAETYPRGAGATHFGEVELDESTGIYQAQISLAIVDPETGAAIGAMTVGVNAEALF